MSRIIKSRHKPPPAPVLGEPVDLTGHFTTEFDLLADWELGAPSGNVGKDDEIKEFKRTIDEVSIQGKGLVAANLREPFEIGEFEFIQIETTQDKPFFVYFLDENGDSMFSAYHLSKSGIDDLCF